MNVGWRPWLLAGAALVVAASATCTSSQASDPEAGTGGGGMGGATASTSDGAGGGCDLAQCPVPSNPCKVAACHEGACSTENALDGTVLAKNVPADCHATMCDGMGGTKLGVDLSNVPVPGNPCLQGTCDAQGTLGTEPAQEGTTCNLGGGGIVCDGAGNCVECLKNGDCAPGDTCTSLNTCMGSPCNDGVLDGDESDIDCGGSCVPCGPGRMCQGAEDCLSATCDPGSHVCVGSVQDAGADAGG